jgi:hypothetical protein
MEVAHGERCGSAVNPRLAVENEEEGAVPGYQRSSLNIRILCFTCLSEYVSSAIAITKNNNTPRNVSIGKTLIRHQTLYLSVRLRRVGVKNGSNKVVDACGRRPGGS